MWDWKIKIQTKPVSGLPRAGKFAEGSGVEGDIVFVDVELKVRPQVDFSYHMIDLAAWDKHWRLDPYNYIPSNLVDLLAHSGFEQLQVSGKKLLELRRFLANGGALPVPVFEARAPSAAGITIEDGRHRIALLRDIGVKFFPAAIPDANVAVMRAKGILT